MKGKKYMEVTTDVAGCLPIWVPYDLGDWVVKVQYSEQSPPNKTIHWGNVVASNKWQVARGK